VKSNVLLYVTITGMLIMSHIIEFSDVPANTKCSAVHFFCINLKLYTVNEVLCDIDHSRW
jgi:hypothetical protein